MLENKGGEKVTILEKVALYIAGLVWGIVLIEIILL